MTGKENIGEQPIFTCNAHVFHIDPKTKRTWITASTKSVSVSFFYDSSRNLYRIISVEGSKAVINSTITPNMSFTQTSQKFGQWSDVRANTVYGLGFSSEAELTKFVEKFQEVKEATKIALAKNASNGSGGGTSANTSPVTGRSSLLQVDNNNTEQLVEPPSSIQSMKMPIADPQQSPSHKPTVAAPPELKPRLTSALQESTANVDEWKRQLQTYKEENLKMKVKLQEMTDGGTETGGGGGGDTMAANGPGMVAEDLRKEIILLKSRIESLEGELKLQEVELKTANMNLRDKNNDPSMKQLLSLFAQFAKNLTEINLVHKEMEKILHNQKST